MKNLKIIFVVLFVIPLLLTACAQGEVALQLTGNVAEEQAWTEAQVKKLDTIDVDYTNKDGEVSTHSGVLVTDLLAEAGVNDEATAVVFVGDDGYTVELTLEEVQACADCIVSFQDGSGFEMVMPGFSGKAQVKGVIEIQVK